VSTKAAVDSKIPPPQKKKKKKKIENPSRPLPYAGE
jgi:hypothetical protein